MARPPKRPAPLALGSYTVRATGAGPDDAGRWLWRLEWYPEGQRGSQRTRGIGRLAAAEVETTAFREIAAIGAPGTTARGSVASWGVLLRAALKAWEKEGASAGRPKPRTLAVYRASVSYLLSVAETWPLPSGARALAVQARDMRDRLLRRRDEDEGLAASTTAVTLRIAGMAWDWGVREELVDPLPWQAPSIEVAPPQRHAPTLAEAAAVLAELRAHCRVHRDAPHAWPVIAWLVHHATAPRIGELASLTVGDWLPVDGAVWYGRHAGDAKTGPRLAVLDAGAVAEVERYLQARRDGGEVLSPDTRFWPVERDTVRHTWWARWIYPAMDRARVPRWPAHAARGAVADDMADASVDEVSVDAQLGNTAAIRAAYYRRALTGRVRSVVQARALVPAPDDAVIILDPRRRRT